MTEADRGGSYAEPIAAPPAVIGPTVGRSLRSRWPSHAGTSSLGLKRSVHWVSRRQRSNTATTQWSPRRSSRRSTVPTAPSTGTVSRLCRLHGWLRGIATRTRAPAVRPLTPSARRSDCRPAGAASSSRRGRRSSRSGGAATNTRRGPPCRPSWRGIAVRAGREAGPSSPLGYRAGRAFGLGGSGRGNGSRGSAVGMSLVQDQATFSGMARWGSWGQP